MGKARKFAAGALIAAGVGYVAGILTAPKSGKETRKDIQDTAAKAKTESEKQLKHLHSELSDLIDAAQKHGAAAQKGAKKNYDNAMATAKTAKAKARDVLSAVHEGEAKDKDLNRAIAESKKAAEHLKSFVTSNGKKA